MEWLIKYSVESPFLTFFICMGVLTVIQVLFFRLPNRIIRHLNIRKHGWPPAHCDADGDFKPEPEDE